MIWECGGVSRRPGRQNTKAEEGRWKDTIIIKGGDVTK